MDDEGGDALLEIKHDDSAAKKIEWHGIWNTQDAMKNNMFFEWHMKQTLLGGFEKDRNIFLEWHGKWNLHHY